MEESNSGSSSIRSYYNGNMISPEIVEISEESRSCINSNKDEDGIVNDVYVAVGKDDLDVLKWAIDHLVLPGASVFLIHVFPPITFIPTPVGRMSRNQISQEQVKAYIREENTKRTYLLQKYIRLCNDSKVPVETMLIESDTCSKAIVELVSVLNIKILVMGTKRSPSSSRGSRKGTEKSKYVQKNAAEFCDVTTVSDGKKVVEEQEARPEPTSPASKGQQPERTRNREKNFFDCGCFSGKFK